MQKSMYSRFLLFISIMLVPCFSQAQISKDSTKFLGNVASESLSEEFLTFWNQVTPENASKWINIEKERDVMTWTILDSIYVSAKRNGLPIKLHTLVWGQQQPAWINQLSQNEQREEVEEWFEALAERYPDADIIDVVNEPLHHPAPYRNALGGSGETGWDWAVWSFKKAREVFPNSKLLINDYDILNNYKNTVPKYRELIGILKDSMLLDGIGCQSHFLESYSTKLISRMLDSLATHEIPIYISEFDLQFTSDQGQLTKYEQVFPLLWEHPMVKGVTLWGYKEGSIWRDDAYLKRQDKSHSPAFTWLIEYFNNGEPISLENIVFEDDTTYLFPGQLYYPKVRFEPTLYSEEVELL